MPSTVETTEKFPGDADRGDIEAEKKLRIKAGAITCRIEGGGEAEWTLTCSWNVLGEDDD